VFHPEGQRPTVVWNATRSQHHWQVHKFIDDGKLVFCSFLHASERRTGIHVPDGVGIDTHLGSFLLSLLPSSSPPPLNLSRTPL